MNREEIISNLANELMYEDEYLDYTEAIQKATEIYENMFKEDEGGI